MGECVGWGLGLGVWGCVGVFEFEILGYYDCPDYVLYESRE